MTINKNDQDRAYVNVETGEQLDATVTTLADGDLLAFDTEFIRERTYYPHLCLLQIASESHVACIDVLACGDIGPIWDLLMDPQRIKIAHSARQDLELILNETDRLPTPLFDTQIAAAINGYGLQISYGDLVDKELDVQLDKAHTRTDWSRRPLNTEQLEYAADDVRHLIPLYRNQCAALAEKQRLAWAREESALLVDESLYRVHPEDAWQKVKGAGKLRGSGLATVKSIAAWREEFAIRADRPRRWIMDDRTLLALALNRPDTVEAMQHITGMNERQMGRRGAQLLAVIQNAPNDALPDAKNTGALDLEQRQLVKRLSGIVDQFAETLSVSKEILATRRDLEQLVRHGKSKRLLDGWRGDVIGNRLLSELQPK